MSNKALVRETVLEFEEEDFNKISVALKKDNLVFDTPQEFNDWVNNVLKSTECSRG